MFGGTGISLVLVASSDEAALPCELETVAEPEADPEAKGDSEPEADPAGDSISVSSSSDWEAVTTSGITCWDLFRVVRGTMGDVLVEGGTYEGSVSASVSLSISQELGATDLDFPLGAKVRAFLGAMVPVEG